jgi:hypothetical protein
MNSLLTALVISLVLLLIVSYSRYKFRKDLQDRYNEGDDLILKYDSIKKDLEEDES